MKGVYLIDDSGYSYLEVETPGHGLVRFCLNLQKFDEWWSGRLWGETVSAPEKKTVVVEDVDVFLLAMYTQANVEDLHNGSNVEFEL